MHHLVIINPKSFRKKAEMLTVARNINAFFESMKDTQHIIYTSQYPRDAMMVVNEYVGKTNETVRVYSVGGDGILYDCLNGLINMPNAELAVMPYGTSNDFVRAFGEGKEQIFRDIAKQVAAPVIPTDVINLGTKYAINFCCIGGEAAVIVKSYIISRNYPLIAKLFGRSLYTLGIPMAFFDKQVVDQKYEVYIDGVHSQGDYLGINIANGPCYGGNKTPMPMASPTDGRMDIMTLTSEVNPRLFNMLYHYTKGRFYKYPAAFCHVNAKEIVIRSDYPMHINADGETHFKSEIHAKIVPGAVKIASPDGLSYVRRQ